MELSKAPLRLGTLNVTARARVWVYVWSLRAGSNPSKGMDVRLLNVLYVVKVQVSA